MYAVFSKTFDIKMYRAGFVYFYFIIGRLFVCQYVAQCPKIHTNANINKNRVCLVNFSVSQLICHSFKLIFDDTAANIPGMCVHLLLLVTAFETEPVHEISNNVVSATSKVSDQPAHMRSLIRAFASRLSIL